MIDPVLHASIRRSFFAHSYLRFGVWLSGTPGDRRSRTPTLHTLHALGWLRMIRRAGYTLPMLFARLDPRPR